MTTFSQQLQRRLERHLRDRRLLVFYDPRSEFADFVEKLPTPEAGGGASVQVGDTPAWMVRYDGSYLAVRRELEERLEGWPKLAGLVYLAGEERDRKLSPLMEFELAGGTYEPQLRRIARDIFRERFSDAQIDEYTEVESIGYAELARIYDGEGGGAEHSLLHLVYGPLDSEPLLARFVLESDRDDDLEAKGARPELIALIRTRLGLELDSGLGPAEIRSRLVRYLLVNEFRFDLDGSSPEELDMVPAPTLKEERERIRTLADRLRGGDAEAYGRLADRVEADLGLAGHSIEPARLGSVDTFRFEERLLLTEGARLLEAEAYDEAAALCQARGSSHWVVGDPLRAAQWNALRRAAALGQALLRCEGELKALKGRPPSAWVERYTSTDQGWSTLDFLHRDLGRATHSMDEPAEAEAGIRKVRARYSEWVRILTEGFVEALKDAEWDPGVELHQTRIFDDVVQPRRGPVAFFLVDALRYELGVELMSRLRRVESLTLTPAVAALPTITSVGMAALLPGASASFSVQGTGSGIAGAIDGHPLPTVKARLDHLRGRVPGAVDLTLAKALELSDTDLATAVADAPLVVVRSQDIDAVGEAGAADLMEQTVSGVLPNLARTVLRLAEAGIRRFVIAADHGYLVDSRQDDDMKIPAPGGDQVELHRRCWAGRGGATPSGAVRVSGDRLGYDTDLDFIFPAGRGVFLSGGDLQYHHGGLSLQEMVIPVLSGVVAARTGAAEDQSKVQITDHPPAITNRIIVVGIRLGADLFAEAQRVQVVLLAGAKQVGEALMAQGADFDAATKTVGLKPEQAASVGIQLGRDDVKSAKVAVLDADSGAVLAQTKPLKLKLTH